MAALTEAQWLECKSINLPVMKWVRRYGSDRKFYLAAAAAVRMVADQLIDADSRAAIDVVERFADGQATLEEMQAARDAAARADFLGPPTQATLEDSRRQYAGMAAMYAATPPNELAPRNGPRGVWIGAYNALDYANKAGKMTELRPRHAALLRDIIGNPFRTVTIAPGWRTSNVAALAQGIYEERAFERMPILADALEEAGCTEATILDHCRQLAEHVRGCWVVDFLLGKA
jgi:hypothetical protein